MIYLVIIAMFNEKENSIVNICSTRDKAESLVKEYTNSWQESGEYHEYYIQELDINTDSEILWDCYRNSKYFRR